MWHYKLDHYFSRWFGLLDRFSGAFIFSSVLICIILSTGLAFLEENNDGRIFFDEQSPERQQLKSLEQSFTETNSILLVLSPKNGDVFTAQSLKAILEVTELAWKLPYVTRVNSLTNYQHISSHKDDVIINDLISEDILSDKDALQKIRKYALSEDDLVGQILSSDGTTTAIVLNVAAPRGKSNIINVIMLEVKELKKTISDHYEGMAIYVTGDIPLDNAFSDAYSYDLQYLFPAFLCVVFFVCYFFFRSLWLSVIILSMMLMVVLSTIGVAGFIGINLTAGTSGVPIILITISLADFIHLVNGMRGEMRAGRNRSHAIRGAIRKNFLPITLTSFTTFIGFLSLNFSDAPPFRDMGNLVAIGIIISYMLTFAFFPLMLEKINFDNILKKPAYAFSVSPEIIISYAKLIFINRNIIVILFIVASVFVSIGLTKIEFDDDWVKYFDAENIFRKDTEYVVDHLTGVDTIEYIISSGKEGGITNPVFLNKLDKFKGWALAQQGIVHVSSIVPIFKKINFHMNATSGLNTEVNLGKYDAIANNADLNAQYLLLYEMSLPTGLDLNDRINISKEATRLTITAKNLTSRQLRDLDLMVSKKLQKMTLIGPDMRGTGIPLMFANLSERNIKSMFGGIAFALIVVSLVIIIAFRSFKLGLISFVVNILPIILGFGVWGWFYQYVGVSLTVVSAIAFGIVVDDSIHFLAKYNKVMKQNGDNIEHALRVTFTEVGGSLVMTTIILSLGFAILSFSLFQPTWELGLISVIMILIALAYDIMFLPAVLVIFGGMRNKKFG